MTLLLTNISNFKLFNIREIPDSIRRIITDFFMILSLHILENVTLSKSPIIINGKRVITRKAFDHHILIYYH